MVDAERAVAKFKSKVQRVVREGTLVHLHLACGHLITEHASDLAEQVPSEVECWACDAERENSVESDKRLKEKLR